MIQPTDTVLFQGDSITDANRDRSIEAANDPAGFGRGYALLTAAELLAQQPARRGDGLQVFNRGISGNNVVNLHNRWRRDCIDLKPNVLSILIGVNDTWHGTAKGNPDGGTSLDTYDKTLRQLLQQALDTNPDMKLVLCEPFVLRCGEVTDAFFPEIDQRREIVRQIATEFHATFVPFQQAFNDALNGVAPDYWAFDGVHPTLAGHQLMARTWLNAVNQ